MIIRASLNIVSQWRDPYTESDVAGAGGKEVASFKRHVRVILCVRCTFYFDMQLKVVGRKMCVAKDTDTDNLYHFHIQVFKVLPFSALNLSEF